MVCGAVPTGGQVSVYLSAETSKAGTFHYAVKFADISGGTTVYVDQKSDGTHQIVSWSEVTSSATATKNSRSGQLDAVGSRTLLAWFDLEADALAARQRIEVDARVKARAVEEVFLPVF